MCILLIDTTRKLYIAILSKNVEIIDEIEQENIKISENILENIIILLNRNKIEKFAIAAVNIGPGSFVGTRAGITAVMGMRAALHMSIITFSNMEIIAFAMQKAFHVVLHSHQEIFYIQKWHSMQAQELKMITYDILLKNLEQYKIIGDYGKCNIKHKNFLYQPIIKQHIINLLQYKLKNKIYSNNIIQQHVKYK